MQCYVYYRRFPKDKMILKILVGFLLLADTLNTILDCHFTYSYGVSQFGNISYLAVSVPTFNSDPIMTGIISSTTQAFFGWRVMKLSHSVFIATIIWFFAGLQLLASLGTTIACTIIQHFDQFHKFGFMVTLWLAGSACADLLITTTLVYQLSKSRTGFAATDDLITRLVRLTLQTGLITTTFAIVDLILFQCFTNNLHLIFNLPLCKLYTNSLLSTLNARSGGWSTGMSLPEESSSASRNRSRSRSVGGGRQKSNVPNFQLSSHLSARSHRERQANLDGGITVMETEMVRHESMDLEDRKAVRAGLAIGGKESMVTAGRFNDGADGYDNGHIGVPDNADGHGTELTSPYYATHHLPQFRREQSRDDLHSDTTR